MGGAQPVRRRERRFAELWDSGAVGAHREDHKIVDNPAVGPIAVDHHGARRPLARSLFVPSGVRARKLSYRSGVRGQDRVHQPGEAGVEIVFAQAHVSPGALDPLGDDPRLAQDA